MQSTQNRRRFLATLSSAGVAGLIGAPYSSAAEPPPETTTVRFPKFANTICGAPILVIDGLLRAEGFTDIRYVPTTSGAAGIRLAARGEVDFENAFVGTHVALIDAGNPITIVGGLHIGCYELFAHGDVRSIRDLKGRTVGVAEPGSSPHLLVSSMASYVGLDPTKEIQWVVGSAENPLDLFANGKIDAFLGFPPEPQELHARKIGRVIVNTARDRPWSQYFCCMVAGNSEFVRKHPIATKRVLRAILKATDFCTADPVRAAQQIVEGGFAGRYDYALQALRDIPYAKWREYSPDDSVRFYALRLREVGMIKSSPNKVLAEGTNWGSWDELKRELKG
jgi:NitT/TauT family transport system substrate-binding protein